MNTKSNQHYQRYLKDLFRPAQDWALSEEGSALISENIPTLKDLMLKHYKDNLFGVYCISLNDKPLYIGESIRTVRRLVVHAYNICHSPELFGLDTTLGDNSISVSLLETGIVQSKARKDAEAHYISTLKPILQKADGTDRCIPRAKRHEAVMPYLKNRCDALSENEIELLQDIGNFRNVPDPIYTQIFNDIFGDG